MAVFKTRRHAHLFSAFLIWPLNNPGGCRGGAGAPPRVAGRVRGGSAPPRRIENLLTPIKALQENVKKREIRVFLVLNKIMTIFEIDDDK